MMHEGIELWDLCCGYSFRTIGTSMERSAGSDATVAVPYFGDSHETKCAGCT